MNQTSKVFLIYLNLLNLQNEFISTDFENLRVLKDSFFKWLENTLTTATFDFYVASCLTDRYPIINRKFIRLDLLCRLKVFDQRPALEILHFIKVW